MDYHGIFGWRVSSGLGKKISDNLKDQVYLQAIQICEITFVAIYKTNLPHNHHISLLFSDGTRCAR